LSGIEYVSSVIIIYDVETERLYNKDIYYVKYVIVMISLV